MANPYRARFRELNPESKKRKRKGKRMRSRKKKVKSKDKRNWVSFVAPLMKKINGTVKSPQKLQFKKKENPDKEFCKWEKHSTGFGSRILAQWGYKPGEGLGRGGAGIVNPVKAIHYKSFSEKTVNNEPFITIEDDRDGVEPTRQVKQKSQLLPTDNDELCLSNGEHMREHNAGKVIDLTEEKQAFIDLNKKHSETLPSSSEEHTSGLDTMKVIDLTGEKQSSRSHSEMNETHDELNMTLPSNTVKQLSVCNDVKVVDLTGEEKQL